MSERTILHVIDSTARADAVDQMLAVRREGERIICLGPAPANDRLGKVESLHCPMGCPSLAWRRLAKLCPAGAIAHVWSRGALEASAKAAQRAGGRVVFSLPHLPTGRLLEETPWEIGQFNLMLTVPTERARRALLDRRAEPDRVFVLPPAAKAVEDAPKRRKAVREALQLPDDELLFASPAEIIPSAGHKLSSWAHAICREVQPRGRLVFTDPGPAEPHVKFFADTAGFGHEVFYTHGRFARADVLAAADVAMFFYERDCGLTVVVEAMSAGLAILAARTDDLQAVLTDGQDALLAETGNPRSAGSVLLRVIDDADLRRRLGRAAAQKARAELTPARARGVLDEIYARLA